MLCDDLDGRDGGGGGGGGGARLKRERIYICIWTGKPGVLQSMGS